MEKDFDRIQYLRRGLPPAYMARYFIRPAIANEQLLSGTGYGRRGSQAAAHERMLQPGICRGVAALGVNRALAARKEGERKRIFWQ